MIKLLMLGDSLAEWGDWKKLLPEYLVVNRGIAGEMTDELAVRLNDEMESCPHADVILVESGTNNFLLGYLFFPSIIKMICYRLRLNYPHCPIIINSLMPMPIVQPKVIADLNAELQAVAEEMENMHFLDTVGPFNEHCLPITHPGFLNDQVHLSTRGYQVWAEAIRTCLRGLFP